MTANPYTDLPDRAFWRRAVADVSAWEMDPLWTPRLAFAGSDRFVTYGSCFAQHIGQALKRHGYDWLNAEPSPPELPEILAKEFNYGVFSARTQNIYTTSLFDQWLGWALDRGQVPEEVWEENGRYFDPFRPTVEPRGFVSLDELVQARHATLRAIRRSVVKADVLVFTLGLTEGWVNRRSGYVYASCPGTAYGEFDPELHSFVNFNYSQVRESLESALARIRRVNTRMRVLLTVSPVPLTATADNQHVVTATTYSKSVLRAVAGDVVQSHDFVDYFPSYEYFTSMPFRASLFDSNLRTASRFGVDYALSKFLSVLPPASGEPSVPENLHSDDDVICEDAMLEAFAPGWGDRHP